MASAGQKRKRSERVAALELPPGQWERAWSSLGHRDVRVRIGLALAAAAAMCVVIRGWEPPFALRTGYAPARPIVARVPFTQIDSAATRQRALSQVRYVYSQDPVPVAELRALLRNRVVGLTAVSSLAEVDPDVRREFGFQLPPSGGGKRAGATERQTGEAAEGLPENAAEQQFQQFREAFTGQDNLDRFEALLKGTFGPLEQRGVLEKLPQEPGKGSQEEIVVYPKGNPASPQVVKVAEVLIGDGSALRETLASYLPSPEVVDRLFDWILPRLKSLKPTLVLDEKRTYRAEQEAIANAEPVLNRYQAAQTLAEAGAVIDSDRIRVLRLEHVAWLDSLPWTVLVLRGLTAVAVIFAMFLLCGVYMRYRQRGPLSSVVRLVVMLLLGIVTVYLAKLASADQWRGELAPLLLFGMIVAIVHRRELALLLSGILAFALVLAIGHGLSEYLLIVGVATLATLSLGRIRSRSKLIYIGLAAGLLAFVLSVTLGILDNQPLGEPLLRSALYNGGWALAAGFVMTGLLPFVERTFGVLTDLSLLELGDVSHPLLQELVRRAPSTYNHSVTVGSISEAAAESIGARGLLVRVGAYFHDIGKMLKPGYFIENQGSEASRHESLVPAMSTLVIIAHIKDGADLARQHRLPQPIIDLIGQHHGTTLVEYFYDRANEQRQADPGGAPVDESNFRYPGPKPQTKEAAVLMLADAVESASRTLVDPTPARIENLVRDIAERRLHDGQFDESGLTLRELRTIERSMVMSLISIYHGRIKYPDQRTA